ncbi:hypothetical protein AGOR_G00148180 [Albula goreensis]|uniref:Uncharacterized protein n=1 Tax=Albula goreensis TaxID=1534307 RepID=A0A8T3D6Q0_9TELE|nr:hypothetical protein AGOR_G00148180 [Albula goreensis]
MMGCFLSLVEPVVIVSTVGNSFYGTALTLAVYNRTLELTGGQSDQAQALSSHFFLVNSCVTSLLSFVATALLGWLADRHGPRVLLVVPQIGYFLSKFFLLAFVLLHLPLSVLYVEGVVHGLCGGGPAFWGGVISLAALSSDQEQRSLKLNVVDFCSGVAGW